MTKRYLDGALALLILLTSCVNEIDMSINQLDKESGRGISPLQITVNEAYLTKAIGQLTGTSFPDGAEIGVFATAEDGSLYDGNSYDNIPYTASGTGSNQTWSTNESSTLMLSTTKAKIFAYYPREASGVSLTSIKISNDGTDWLYTPYAASDISVLNPEAKLSLQHAITIIRVKIVAGNEYATGTVSDLTLAGNGWATAATLNLLSGKFGSYEGEGTPLTATALGTLSMTALEKEFWVVSNETESVISFKTTVGEEQYKVYTPTTVKLERGKIYNYTVTVDNYKGATLSSVELSEWTAEANSDMDTEDYNPWVGLSDGVYAIDKHGMPVEYAIASAAPIGNYQGVAVSLKGKAFEVAKVDASEATKFAETYPMSESELAVLEPYKINTVDGSSNYKGWLKRPNQTYDPNSTYNLSDDISTWTTGALSDMDGQANTQRVLQARVTIASVITAFNASVNNQGSTSWYLPAFGQLAYMYLNYDKLNQIMKNVGGKAVFPDFSEDSEDDDSLWSSSVGPGNGIWRVRLKDGLVNDTYPTWSYRARLIQDL